MANEDFESTVEDFSTEIENGIFGLIVTLCQHKANFSSVESAKEEVAQYLEKLIEGLRFTEETPLKGNK